MGKRTICSLVQYYLETKNVVAASTLLYIAVKRTVTLQDLFRFGEKLGKITGEHVSRSRIASFLTTWRMHRFVENTGRGVYTVGPNLDLSDLEDARRILAQVVDLSALGL